MLEDGQLQEQNTLDTKHNSSWWSSNWLSWSKYSESMLRSLEKKILQIVRKPHRGCYVDIGPVVGSADKIWTISLNTESQNTPLVLLHGLGAGVALWCLNLDAVSSNRPVYAIDLLGFGRSSRPNFSSDGAQAEQQMIKSIEEWAQGDEVERIHPARPQHGRVFGRLVLDDVPARRETPYSSGSLGPARSPSKSIERCLCGSRR
ncbi:hypothetical protein NQ318_003857 [Aromia moschata]|uniref:AB hydrolase-1 domain-containing protein n=1 Tax=Aromia moschata TaxID=1265417 RepID=A0AAV8Z778_9CUCU|nr:hypothetical protein NQ318_003857 [Aromia moschata]